MLDRYGGRAAYGRKDQTLACLARPRARHAQQHEPHAAADLPAGIGVPGQRHPQPSRRPRARADRPPESTRLRHMRRSPRTTSSSSSSSPSSASRSAALPAPGSAATSPACSAISSASRSSSSARASMSTSWPASSASSPPSSAPSARSGRSSGSRRPSRCSLPRRPASAACCRPSIPMDRIFSQPGIMMLRNIARHPIPGGLHRARHGARHRDSRSFRCSPGTPWSS